MQKMERRNISLRNRCPKGKLKLTSFQIGGVQEFVMNFVCVIHRLAFEYRRKKQEEIFKRDPVEHKMRPETE